MTTTVRLLATHNGNPPQTIVRLPDATAAFFVAQGTASLDLTGGINKAPPAVAHNVGGSARLIYSTTGTLLGIGDVDGNLLLTLGGATTPSGATAPGAPTSFALTAAAGAVIGAFAAPASNGGDPIQWYEMTLSNGAVVRGDASPIAAAAPAGTSVSATVRAINAVGPSAASNSSSATPTGTIPGVVAPGAPTIGVLVSGNGKVTANWIAPASNGGAAITGYTITPSVGSPVTVGNVLTADVTVSNGTAVTVTVKATNASALTGPDSAASNSVTPAAATVAPGVTSAAAIVGTPEVNTPLTITAAVFTGNPTPTVTRTIQVAGVTVATGPVGSTNYTPVTADIGKTIVVISVATNGTAPDAIATSAASAATIAAQPATVAPNAPTIGALVANTGGFTVNFTPAAFTNAKRPGGFRRHTDRWHARNRHGQPCNLRRQAGQFCGNCHCRRAQRHQLQRSFCAIEQRNHVGYPSGADHAFGYGQYSLVGRSIERVLRGQYPEQHFAKRRSA